MSDGPHGEILKRKIGGQSGRADQQLLSPTRAFRRAVERTCEATRGLAAGLAGFTDRSHPGNTEPPDIQPVHLCLSMAAPDGRRGLALIDGIVTASLIEQLTTGRLNNAAPDDREPTPTDAMFAGGFLDRLLTAVDAEFGQQAGAMPWGDLRVTGRLSDSRAAGLWLADGAHRCVTVDLDIADGARKGAITLLVPAADPAATVRRSGSGDWQRDWHRSLLGATTEVEALLYRFTLPLSAVARLAPGMMIEVPATSIGKVALAGKDGTPIAGGRLGMANGRRAVRIQPGAADWPDAEAGTLIEAGRGPLHGAPDGADPASQAEHVAEDIAD